MAMDDDLVVAGTEVADGATASDGRDDSRGRDSVVLTRSEEQVQFRTVRRVSEVVRIRRRIVTEERTITVPVRREELVLERSPAPAAGTTPPDEPPPDGIGEIVWVLSEEEVVVDTRIVPTERVRISVRTVTEDVSVGETVRREQIDLEREQLDQRR